MNLASVSGTSMSSEQADVSGLENRFCRDFVCCGIQLENLHDLLQHFEECHVHVESEGEDFAEDGLTFEFDTMDGMDTDMDDAFGGPCISSSFIQKQSIALSEIYSANRSNSSLASGHLSAFDTSIVRKHSSSSRSKRNPPTFTVNHEPQTIPLAFDGPTRVISDMDVDESHFGLATMSVHPLGMKMPLGGEGAFLDGHSSSASTIMTDADDEKDDRPYKCKVPGCQKAYKNPGGLKYHMQHGHCEDTGDPEMNNILNKPYQCTVADCGKRYKNLNGLKVCFSILF